MRRRTWGFTKHAACVVSMFALLAGFSANAQDMTLFVRGTMNEWGTANQMTAANNIYTTVLVMEAGEHEFKIANADWSVNFGLNSEPVVALDAAKTLAAGEGNLKVTLPEKGAYKVAFDFSNQAQPSLTVKAAQAVVIHYHRKNADYEGWGLHLWNAATPSMPESALAGIAWDKPRAFDGQDDFGAYAILEIADAAAPLNFIIHKGNEKDQKGLDMAMIPQQEGLEIWLIEGDAAKYANKTDALINAGAVGDLRAAKARWISRDSLVWDVPKTEGLTPYLYVDPDGALTLENGVISMSSNGKEIPLTFNGAVGENDTANDQKLAYLPYLKGRARIATTEVDAAAALTGAIAVALKTQEGKLADATSIQTAGILDDLYAYSGELGVAFADGAPTLSVWAPTAQSVKAHVYADSTSDKELDGSPFEMTKLMDGDKWTGVWQAVGTADWKNLFYRYEVKVFAFWSGNIETFLVTDPYSVSLATNSARSQIVDLADAALQPEGWAALQKPALNALEDTVLYELHVRDFSIADATVPEADRGKFTAFAAAESNGMKHLKSLSEAGLTHVHLLPAFDIATIQEDAAQRIELTSKIDDLCAKNGADIQAICAANAGKTIQQVMEEAVAADPASDIPAQLTAALQDLDGFNWGYDPFHYGVPEGSYCANPDGAARIVEFRKMVNALSAAGLRVVMDVVYNHTNAARDGEKSALDKLAPGYYYRLDDEGNIQNSTCCPDTATEHVMMEKLMLDTLKRWAVAYKVDGFRFDLMGHHTRQNMLNVRKMLDGLTVEQDGVDGSKLYVYGEGWRFGSIQTNLPSSAAPGEENAAAAFTQTNSGNAGIGTFNDRVRDSARGGNFQHSTRCDQGFISGLFTDYNACADNAETSEDLDEQKHVLLNYTDNIRLAMAANLKDYEFMGYEGKAVKGADVDYRGAAAGYAAQPKECVNYVSAHDNYALFDQISAKAPFKSAGRTPETATAEDRARMARLGLSIVALGEGIPFFHAGDEMLRSKSGDGDSYNAGDWYNSLDWTYSSNKWGVGLPNKQRNEAEWPFWTPRLQDAGIRPTQELMTATVEYFKALLRARKSSPLFRLQTAEDVMKRVAFLNAESGAEQIPGLIVMRVSDTVEGLADLDPARKMVVVAMNAAPQPVEFAHDSLKGLDLTIHPNLDANVDAALKDAAFDAASGKITVPGRSTVVFVELQ